MKSNTAWTVSQYEEYGFVFLFLSLACAFLGIYGNYGFSQADYWVYGWNDYDEWTDSEGYNVVDFVYYLFSCYFFPLSIVFMLVFMSHSYKRIPSTRIKIYLYSSLLMAFLVAASYSFYYGRNVLTCLVFYCVGGTEYDSGATNIQTMMGTIYFFVSIFFVIGYGGLLVFAHNGHDSIGAALICSPEDNLSKSGARPSTESDPLVARSSASSTSGGSFGSTPTDYRRSNDLRAITQRNNSTGKLSTAAQVAIIVTVFVVFYPVLVFACMLLPTWWNLFTWTGIQYYQELVPDLSYGYYFSWTSGSVVGKLFPDIVLFYGFIYAVAFTSLCAAWFPSFRDYLLYRPVSFRTFTVGQVSLAVGLIFLIAGEFCYWFLDHGWELEDRSNFTDTENAARAMGQVANVLMGLGMLPASKNNVWGMVFGVSWEEMLAWHQMMGYGFLIAVFMHMCLFWGVFAANGSFPSDILNVPESYHGDNFTVPLAQITYYVSLICLGLFTLDRVRRAWYELFYFVHVTFVPIMILVVLWHATMAWYYIMGGVILYTIDVIIRLTTNVTTEVYVKDISVAVRPSIAGVVASSQVSGGIVRLAYTVYSKLPWIKLSPDADCRATEGAEGRPLCHQMGQYCFVNIPEIDLVEWHPFTISSAPVDNMTTHHIKSMGESQWTGKLYSLALEIEALPAWERERRIANLSVSIDGPYGVPVDIENYTHLLLVAGGIGVTPLHSCFRQLYAMINPPPGQQRMYGHVKSVRLLWVVKSASEIASCLDTFAMLPTRGIDGIFSVRIFVTQTKKSSDFEKSDMEYRVENFLNVSEYIHTGRPSLPSEIASLRPHGKSGLIFVCGPETLVNECSILSMHSGIHFRSETFLF